MIATLSCNFLLVEGKQFALLLFAGIERKVLLICRLFVAAQTSERLINLRRGISESRNFKTAPSSKIGRANWSDSRGDSQMNGKFI
jgi:hypothetical protein